MLLDQGPLGVAAGVQGVEGDRAPAQVSSARTAATSPPSSPKLWLATGSPEPCSTSVTVSQRRFPSA